ncbi:MAG: Rieske 2Fe-2S domain-containing protein [Gemmatimonadaceae bacterium]
MSGAEQAAADESQPAGPDGASEDVLAEVERLIGVLTAHPDPAVGQTVTALLDRVDAVHRTALAHLMGAIQSMAGDAFVNRLTGDPAIRLLLMSYDLLAVDRRTLAEEALDAVRGHLHAHGVDVELVEVLGGVVSIRLHGAPPPDDPSYDGIVRDIDQALHAGLLGFQELEVRDGKGARPVSKDSTFLPLAALQLAFRPVYSAVCPAADIAPGSTRSAIVNGMGVLLAHVDGEFYAVQNACGDGPLPLDYSTLDGAELTCSWHRCRYDIRTGHRLDYPDAGQDEQLAVYPVRVRDGMIEVVVGTAPMSARARGA